MAPPREKETGLSQTKFLWMLLVGAALGATGLAAGQPPGPPAGFKLKGDPVAGKALFSKHCALCHGDTGNGRGLIKYDPPPRDLTDAKLMTPKSDWEIYRVVRDGGKIWGLSPAMLSFQGKLDDKALQDVATYVRTLAKAK